MWEQAVWLQGLCSGPSCCQDFLFAEKKGSLKRMTDSSYSAPDSVPWTWNLHKDLQDWVIKHSWSLGRWAMKEADKLNNTLGKKGSSSKICMPFKITKKLRYHPGRLISANSTIRSFILLEKISMNFIFTLEKLLKRILNSLQCWSISLMFLYTFHFILSII